MESFQVSKINQDSTAGFIKQSFRRLYGTLSLQLGDETISCFDWIHFYYPNYKFRERLNSLSLDSQVG